jgi:hypothetical protein
MKKKNLLFPNNVQKKGNKMIAKPLTEVLEANNASNMASIPFFSTAKGDANQTDNYFM